MQSETLTDNGTTEVFKSSKQGRGATCIATGSFDSGTLAFQMLVGATWVALPSATLTAEGSYFIELPESVQLRAVLTGSTTPSITVVFI